MVAGLLVASQIQAQSVAQDDAAKLVYANGWQSGTNGGTGFGPWTLFANPGVGDFSGFFIGGSGAGSVDVSNKSFAIYANGANYNYAIAQRAFGSALTTNVVFTLKFKNNAIATGKQVGVSLFNGTTFTQTNDFNTLAGAARFNFYFVGGNSSYTIWDGGGSFISDVPYHGDGLTLEFSLRSADTYAFTVKSADGTAIISSSVIDYPLQGSGTIDSFACYALDNDTANGDLFVNQFAVVPTSQIPPVIQNVLPANNSVYLPTSQTIAFNAVSPFSGIATNGITVSLNGTNVTSYAFAGSSTNRSVTAMPTLAANTIYNAKIVVADINGNRATNTFTFNTWNTSATYIEAEDYNYNKGLFNPAPTIGWYGNIISLASNTVDIFEYGDPTNATGFANNYRPQDPIWLEASGDSLDHNNFTAFSVTNYAMGFIANGEWQNYTRRLTNGAYNVYARMSGGPAPVMLLERTASPTATTASQPRVALGTFVGGDTGNISLNYAFVPLKDFFSNPVLLRFSTNAPTTNTFRLTDIGADSYNLDYLIFVPITVANTNTQRPYVSAGFPFPGAAGVLPDQTISFTIANRETTNVPALTKLYVNGAEVTGSLNYSNNTAGTTYTCQPATLYPLNTSTTLRAVFTDASGITQTNDWQFGVANILVIPPAYALPTGSGLNSGFNLHVVKYPDVWPVTATPTPGSSTWAEAMLAASVANATPVSNISLAETNVINYELCGVQSPDGYTFANEVVFPGISLAGYAPCANTNGPGNFALSAVTYVQLTAGLHRWAVRSDDGFRLATGNSANPTNTLIMDYEGYRGAQNPSEFYFVIQTTGVYPMRLLYYQGGFGASLELYSIDRTNGQPILINDPANGNSIKAYRATTGGAGGVTLLNPHHNGSTTTFSFQTQAGRTHYVRYKNALADPTWLPLQTITGNGSATNITDATASGATRYYRVETQ